MDFEDEEEAVQPHYAQKFRAPSDPILLAAYELFKPSSHTLNLYSERNREIFAEAFIEGKLDTLENLCVKSLATLGIRGISPTLLARPGLMRVFYDALDVELPLSECYLIDDQRFWRRVVLSKTLDKTLHLKRWNEFDWKSEGVSRKFVERVESCPVNVKPEKRLAQLAEKVWEYVSSMHVRKLQALPDYAFLRYIESDPEDDVTSASSDEEDVSSDEPDTDLGIDGEGEEEQESSSSSSAAIQFWRAESEDEETARRNARRLRNANRQQAREAIAKKKADHEQRRRLRQAKRDASKYPDPSAKKKKKKKKEPPIQDVFSITVPPENVDDEDTKPDKRNKLLMLERIKRYDYPDDHCHHIDLGFVRFFGNMVSFTLEFLGPPHIPHYHSRLMKFSAGDMVRLSRGLRCLPNLKTFKLRNGHLDLKKFRILARALRTMDSLEEVDFGYDQMTDECSEGLSHLLKRPKMYRIIQLEYNRLGTNSAVVLAEALSKSQEGVLEYLGLAHNPLSELAIHSLISGFIGTPHVMALNLSGIDSAMGAFARDIGTLLRSHTPLVSLEMAAISLGANQGTKLLRSLEKNNRVLYADFRECDMNNDQEFEVDMILRRNDYIRENLHHGENLCAVVKERRHPIVQRIEEDFARRTECQKVRPKFSSSSKESIAEVVEEKKEAEEEKDIWALLARWNQTKVDEEKSSVIVKETPRPSMAKPPPFAYEANKFDLEQFRESVFLPGPGNRFFYLQKNKTP
ncbi:uncharacterized protein LOC108148219 [Drosophila elegans]|uniref:uncharacterized protein LOC108148219 n=1 Tax=Drosophila elegans TaxID=30023 RepID=UPI0007E8B124|nr:uncharacterized protein LOC108148219 [Drosophila elegans]